MKKNQLFTLFVISLLLISCNTESQKSTIVKKSSYQSGDLPEMIVSVESSAMDTISVVEIYPDTNIERVFYSKDSIGRYSYQLAVSYMRVNRFQDAIGNFLSSAHYGYLVSASFAATGDCFIRMHQNDSALFYLEKALEFEPVDPAAMILINQIKKK